MGFCSISPCLNGGKCFNVEADYECSCPDEFEGKNCQNIKDKCKLPNNKCTGKSKNFQKNLKNFNFFHFFLIFHQILAKIQQKTEKTGIFLDFQLKKLKKSQKLTFLR